MDKEEIITVIKNRIINEKSKHPDLDWALIAATKIYSSFIKEDEKKKYLNKRIHNS